MAQPNNKKAATSAKATTKAVVKTPTSKFGQILAMSGDAVLDRRSELTLKSAQKAMNSHLQQLNDKRDDLEMQMINLTDLSVDTRDSLRPGSKDFNPTQWVQQMCSIKLEIAILDEEIAVAEEVNEEFFAG